MRVKNVWLLPFISVRSMRNSFLSIRLGIPPVGTIDGRNCNNRDSPVDVRQQMGRSRRTAKEWAGNNTIRVSGRGASECPNTTGVIVMYTKQEGKVYETNNEWPK